MTVSTFLQPDNTAQVGAVYKGAIDGAIHVHRRIAGAFACHQNDQGSPDAPDLTVRVDAGALVRAGLVPLEVAAQSTSALTAPSGNPRKDIVYIDNTTGAVGVATGAEAWSPSDPAVPAGKTAVARISWTVGMTEITNADIDDLRVGGSAPEFTGPDVSGSPGIDGTAGLVPAPAVDDEGKYLRTDGWAAVADQVARDMAASGVVLANATGIAGQIGAFYLADPFVSDSLAVKDAASYDATNDWYTSLGTPATSYSNSGGMGDRTGSITVTITGFTPDSGTASNLVDGGFSSNSTDAIDTPPTTINSSVSIKFDFGSGSKKYIDEFKIYSDTGGGLGGTWKWQASNDDSNWTDVSADFSFDAITKTVTGTITDRAGYRYFQMLGVSGSMSSAWWRENEFKIADGATAGNVVLRPSPVSLLTANPSDVMAYFLFGIVDAVTFGTDVIGKISIADGSPEEFVSGSWERVGTYGSFQLWRLDADMTGKTGETLEYSIETANNKEIRLKQCVGCVPLY